MDKSYYTVDEAAKILKLSLVTIYRHTKSGKIPCKRIGRSIRIPGTYLEPKNDNVTQLKKYIFS
ncbi:helix-turn-helix domain-containing protein [Vallitalea pronyensis]|uniref:Helix-turn-helix domain-containing protein n=1 Tax=Vallitalea pronyensis TaxID=1348613 RepID=A0A8J8MPB1_9FIRM|nr:helix-turn-helix domain-containing protein [Vallitalea pronyensis]QUI24903.1 helix-turn-helix domain-containing protein [Vallitalea pronyensis]